MKEPYKPVQEKCSAPKSTDLISLFLMINTLETGGTERQFVTVANALDRERFSVSLGCIKRVGPLASQVDELNEFSPKGNLFGVGSWRARFRLARFLKQKQVQVAHAFDFYSNMMLIPAARCAGVKVVMGSHRQLGDLLTTAKFRVQRHAFRFCDRVVCNSHAAVDSLQAAGVQESKLVVIQNGLPDAAFAQATPALPRDSRHLRIGMIARMNDSIKRHDLFLRVAAKLAPRFPEMEFVLVGDGSLRPALEALTAKLGLRDRVTFLGDRRDISAVLASLDVSVLPSSSESLSNAILESMAAGIAVVATNVGGNPELIDDEHTGLLFPAGDEAMLVTALERLATQPGFRKRLGSSARVRVLSHNSIGSVRHQYQDLYYQLLSEKTPIADLRQEQKLALVKSTHEGLSR